MAVFGDARKQSLCRVRTRHASVLAYSTVLALHTFGMAFLVGLSSMIALRVLGFAPGLPLTPMKKFFPHQLMKREFAMDSFLRHWLASPAVESLMQTAWGWPLCETVHFFGIALLIGGVGLFDLRMLGMAKGLPLPALRRLLPWGVCGFVLCVASGSLFVLGMRANISRYSYDVIRTDVWLQLKLLFMFLAGINLLAFYIAGMSRQVDRLGPDDDAPLLAKVIAATSLFLWLGVIYFGRLIPEGL